MTDHIAAMRQALEAPGCERLKDFYSVGPVQRAAVESFADALDAALAKVQEPVAWGMPNTAITGARNALMMVHLEIPSNDQYGGALWVPLYAAPPAPAATVLTDAEISALHDQIQRLRGYVKAYEIWAKEISGRDIPFSAIEAVILKGQK